MYIISLYQSYLDKRSTQFMPNQANPASVNLQNDNIIPHYMSTFAIISVMSMCYTLNYIKSRCHREISYIKFNLLLLTYQYIAHTPHFPKHPQ